MRKNLEFKYEEIAPTTVRVKVYGGWIVVIENERNGSLTSQFIADKNHEWVALKPEAEVLEG